MSTGGVYTANTAETRVARAGVGGAPEALRTTPTPGISVIVPALDEEAAIAAAVASAREQEPAPLEVLVVDGGSVDRTRERARAAGANVLASPRGRGRQLHAGALAARGSVLFFLHADTRLPAGALAAVMRALKADDVVGGRLRLAFDRRHPVLDAIAYLSRLGWGAAAYGDAGFFVRAGVYRRIGGFEPLPILEDVRFYRRLMGAGRTVVARPAAVTSARRFLRRGPFRQLALDCAILLAHRAGVDPERLARIYRPDNGLSDRGASDLSLVENPPDHV